MSHSNNIVPAAPWKSQFSSHLDEIGGSSVEFTLATVTAEGLPSVRTCIHRGFWASLPENEHNKLPKNPDIFTSDCPSFTTDARMSKVADVISSGSKPGDLEGARSHSGGGGPVEAVFWAKPVNMQWRIRGQCWYISANDIETSDTGAKATKEALTRYMRRKDEDAEWSWKLQVENMFENLSPGMRGTFKNPPPGQPKSDGKRDGEDLGQKAGHLKHESLARKNFRVAVITPERVEVVDLNDPEKAYRNVWTLKTRGESQEWEEIETWP